MIAVPLTAFLLVAAGLFAVGLYAILAQRTAVMVLMGVEVVLSAIGLNLVAFWRFLRPADLSGQIFAIAVITVGAVEMAIGLGLFTLLQRVRRTVEVDRFARLRG